MESDTRMVNLFGTHKILLAGSVAWILCAGFSIPFLAQAKSEKPLPRETLEVIDLTSPKEKAEEERKRLKKEEKKARMSTGKKTFQAKQKIRLAKKSEIREKKSKAHWEKIQKKTKSILTFVHSDHFVIQTLPMQENFYLPETSLDLSAPSTKDWYRKLSNHFTFKSGTSILLHLETFYYSKKRSVVYPNYALQLNIEVPEKYFRNRKRIPAKELKCYLAWVHPDFPAGDLFAVPKSGHLYLWRIQKGQLMGRLDMKFKHEELKTPMHLYGKVRAYQMIQNEYLALQNQVRGKMTAEAKSLDPIALHRDQLRPKYDYKSQKNDDPWVKGRSTSLWQTQKEDL